MAEIVRLLVAGVSVTLGLMNFAGHVSANFIALLALPHLLAATQCVWEIQHAQTERDTASPQIRLSVFSMAFYSSVGVAFILLKVDDLKLSWIHQQLLAGLVILISLVAWERSRVLALRKARTKDELSVGSYFQRLLVLIASGVILLIGFMAVLPPVADFVCSFSPQLKSKKLIDSAFGPPHRPKESGEKPDPLLDGSKASATGNSSAETAKTGRATLPQRVQLKLTEEPRVYLKFDQKQEGETFASKGPIYIRSLGMVNYEQFQWGPGSAEGYWVKEEEDGKKDGRVTLTDPGPALHYTIYVPESDGYAIPALAGVRQLDVPKVYVLPDDWYQIQDTGNIKYGARSQPKIWGQFEAEGCHVGEAPLSYLKVPEGKLGDELRQLSASIFQGRRSLNEVVPALMKFFREQYTYTSKVENKNGLSPLENFLFDERKGYCDLFSTSAALLLRKAGVPSRLAFGYMGGIYDPKEGLFTFQQRHAHSWVEINTKEHGWVICEFTPEDPAAAEGNGGSGGGNAPNLAQFDDASNPESKPNGAEGAKIESPSFLTQLQNILPAYSNSQLAALLGGLVVFGIGWVYMKRRAQLSSPGESAKRAAQLRDQQPAYFREFVTMCAEFGHRRNPGETLLEMQRALKAIQFYHADFDKMTDYHYATRYADQPKDRSKEDGFLRSIREFRRQQKSQQT